MVWAGTNVDAGPMPEGILGTGINAQLSSITQDGHSRLWVTQMIPTADGGAAGGHPMGGYPVGSKQPANSFMTVYQLDQYDLLMRLTGVPAGAYFLETYHNDPCSDVTDANMARIEITGTGVVQKTSTIPVIVQHVWTDAEL
ncbi:MAG: hypothetical protein ACYTBJ_27390, partial [Planctomycetota bacterium]